MTTTRAPSKIIPRAFPGITPSEVSELIKCSQLTNYPAGTILCHENALEDVFYLILEGQVEVTKTINNSEERLLKNLGPGDFFGEMALIHNAPRAATVKSSAPLIALEIHKEAFDRVLENSSSVSLAMVREISRRLRENDELAIDDLRMRASELAEAYQKLAEQEVSRRDFLTNAAHQLRTPLMAANGFLQMLQKGAIPTEKMPDVVNTIARNVQQIVVLVNDILFVQEMELILGKFQPINCVELLKEVVAGVREKAESHQVEVRIKPDLFLPTILGDMRSLERAFTALVDNAIKFSHEKGKVDIRIQRKAGQVAISISDYGIGIKPDAIPFIFDRYYHTDQAGSQLYDGLGLGLAIAKQVVEQHQGRLLVESTPEKGSTFIVWLKTGDAITESGESKPQRGSTL